MLPSMVILLLRVVAKDGFTTHGSSFEHLPETFHSEKGTHPKEINYGGK